MNSFSSKTSLKIIFAGTPDFAAVALQQLLSSHHTVIAVYTQPDRPAGRGRQLTASPVKKLALQHQIPVYQPLTLRDLQEQKTINNLQADVMVVAAYGLILPQDVLSAPRFGCLNIHASLLPRWRGAAPIQRAILAGDTQTGITIMQMDAGLDTGPMLHKSILSIEKDFNSQILHDLLADLGARDILLTLENLIQGKLEPEIQDDSAASYASKIRKEEANLNWNLSAEVLERAVRAFNPWPVAYTHCGEQTLRILEAVVIKDKTEKKPGTLLSVTPEGIDVATGQHGILRLLQLQFPGGKIVSARDIYNAPREELCLGRLLG